MDKEQASLQTLKFVSDQVQRTVPVYSSQELDPWTDQPPLRSNTRARPVTKPRKPKTITRIGQATCFLPRRPETRGIARLVPFSFSVAPSRTIFYYSSNFLTIRGGLIPERPPVRQPRSRSQLAKERPKPPITPEPRPRRRLKLSDIF